MSASRQLTATLLIALAAVLGPAAAGMAPQAGPQVTATGAAEGDCPADTREGSVTGGCTDDTHW
ncbi:hypothetical protein IQ279_06160 [Streptomyces verrucosisporus]|uniref:hypothetical protein n=1 Tax=Streptomyces verrucosisporus TaxID=1695161 RepID=UPI0019CFE176|nr:hypothetical protein [Streptomyces verrucosisporus]MBN3929228.1 hypothetical protein [Streptomyces verrucosisporus]